MRRCTACRTSRPQHTMLRCAAAGDQILIDSEYRMPGRGVYVCRNAECIAKACRSKAFSRGFRRKFSREAMEALYGQLLVQSKEEVNDNQNQ